MRLYRRTKGGPFWLDIWIGGKRIRRSLGVRDKLAAKDLANEIILEHEEQLSGSHDATKKHRQRPIEDHVTDFLTSLDAAGVTRQHRAERERRLRRFIAHGEVRTLDDVNLDAATEWLAAIVRKGLSARTINAGIAALRQWGRWLAATGRVHRNPFPARSLRARNVEEDRRRVRRALTDDEATGLIQAAGRRPLLRAKEMRTRSGVSEAETARLTFLGRTRALAYELMLGTGLRPGEAKLLRWADVLWNDQELRIIAKHAKSRREQRVPLREDLAKALKAHRTTVRERGLPDGATDTVIPNRMFPSHRCFRRDLESAKIPYEDEEERVLDRHALRHTFITRLARTGVHPRTAQELARHSSIELTMKHYTHLRSRDLRGAVEQAACTRFVPVTFQQPASPRISSPGGRAASSTAEDQRVPIQAQGTGAGGGGRNRT